MTADQARELAEIHGRVIVNTLTHGRFLKGIDEAIYNQAVTAAHFGRLALGGNRFVLIEGDYSHPVYLEHVPHGTEVIDLAILRADDADKATDYWLCHMTEQAREYIRNNYPHTLNAVSARMRHSFGHE